MSAQPICHLYYATDRQKPQIDALQNLLDKHQLSLQLSVEQTIGKVNQKIKQQLSALHDDPVLWLDDKDKLSLIADGLSVAPEWDKLQRRVVSAGRKSELLLQAAKITADSIVIDATAGFGHDSLILASTGARVIMLEQQPMMALLLLAEQRRMSAQPNWQKLMTRLHIINIDARSYFADKQSASTLDDSIVDMVYLDPMFPEDSHQDSKTGKGAKVGKHMQVLHQLAYPPTLIEEVQLLQSAEDFIAGHNEQGGRVIVKRPQYAPVFAQRQADESWQNTALRFDGYFA
ncbi:class I SAM-dependent methyltransferase [uncultured Psychrobacter sp.]|uniref:class I SAM-dependent methyltransferase n=1 Tax=Psychrobacter sp. DM8 TaxID=3440636 RepID=UPI00293D485A|nr:class I SAM-dependent methyltransferase [uncultured Psychrobacter sp.]